jgi:hypothetical protein
MRIALLVGAHSVRCSEGPRVRLLPGDYRIDVEGVVDSKLHLLINDEYHGDIDGNSVINILEPFAYVQLLFTNRGSEESITVAAEKVA